MARHVAQRTTVELPVTTVTPLWSLLRDLGRAAPALVGVALSAEGALLGGHVLSRDGAEMLQDPHAPISPGERLLLLSTAAGG